MTFQLKEIEETLVVVHIVPGTGDARQAVAYVAAQLNMKPEQLHCGGSASGINNFDVIPQRGVEEEFARAALGLRARRST